MKNILPKVINKNIFVKKDKKNSLELKNDYPIVYIKEENKNKKKLKSKLNNIFDSNSGELYSFQIQLSKNIENKNISELCKGLYEFIPLGKRFNKNGGFNDLMFNPHQSCFEIDINKNKINFNIHTKSNPVTIENLYKRYFPSCYFTKLEDIPMATENDLIIEYKLKEHYFKSLSIDYTHLQPIASLMDLQSILNEDERLLYQVILTAAAPDWGHSAEEAKKEFKKQEYSFVKMPEDLSLGSIIKSGFMAIGYGITELMNGALELIFEEPEKINLNRAKNITFTNATNQKSKYMGFKTTIRAVIQSKDYSRREMLKHMIDNALTFMDADNKLESYVINKKKKTFYNENQNQYIKRVNERQPSGNLINNNILNVKEVGKLMMLPTKSLQEKFFVDNNIVVTVTNTLDDEIFTGKVEIGELVGESTSKKTYYPSNPELYCLPKFAVGGMGSGKSNFTIGFINDSIKMGNTVIQFDYIDECQIATETKKSNPDNYIAINPNTMLNFSYPEIDSQDLTKDKKALDFSNCILKLIDTLNMGNMNDMTGRMRKILRSAAIICYLTDHANIKYIYRTLTEVEFRQDLLEKLDNSYSDMFSMYITVLEGLTKVKPKTGEEFNDDDGIKYLLDRFDAMMGDGNLLDMYYNEQSSINFDELLNSGKLITIELPQNRYRHKWVKDVIVCFLLHRIWIATENRKLNDRKIVDIILDEVHQLSNSKDLVSEFATETRKFRLGFLFCCQYFNQFKSLLESVEGGSPHYIMLQGCKVENFNHVEPLVKDFTLENFMDLPKYHSMNLILTKQGYQTFITKMPKHY